MGNPRRFLGSGEVEYFDDVTLPAQSAVEVTFRCLQQRFLLRPDAEATQLILGCFGRAYHRYPELNLHVLQVLGNHGCFLASPDSSLVLSSFMRDFLSGVGTRVNGLRDRGGTFFERRYRAISVLDEDAMEDRFRYVLTQGTKENLVMRARDWPGVQSARALCGGPPLVGKWQDRTAESALRRQRERKLERAAASGRSLVLAKAPKVWREYPIELVPMLHWQGLGVGERRARVAAMLADDDESTRRRHERDGTRPLGVPALLATDPFSRPKAPAKSPAPFCHGSRRAARRAHRSRYETFCLLLSESLETAKGEAESLGIPRGGTMAALCHHEPLSPRRPEPAPTVGSRAEYLVAPSIGPPAASHS